MRQRAKVFFRPRHLRSHSGRSEMKLTLKRFRSAVGGAALASILATMASAQSPSWPTPPAAQAESPAPLQAESPAAPEAGTPTAPQSKPVSQLSAARIAQMLASVALYPDDLLADILVAATYPLDVAEAAQWLEDSQNAALKGDQLFSALQQKSWDPSVKSLTPFPQNSAHARRQPRMARAAWRGVSRRSGRHHGRRPSASPSGPIRWQAHHNAARDRGRWTGARAHRRADYDRGLESECRLRSPLRSLIHLRPLALS